MINDEEAVQHHVLAVIEDYTAFDALWQKKNARLVYSTDRVL